MPQRTWPDGNDLERAPEEAAIETWLEESSVYLTIPRPCEAEPYTRTDPRQRPRTDKRQPLTIPRRPPVRQTIDVGIPGGGQLGGAGD